MRCRKRGTLYGNRRHALADGQHLGHAQCNIDKERVYGSATLVACSGVIAALVFQMFQEGQHLLEVQILDR
jgi:hypothetical protein